MSEARPLSEWKESDGIVFWWEFPIVKPPHCGSPLCTDWPGYHTHWTPIELPTIPVQTLGQMIEENNRRALGVALLCKKRS